MKFLHQRLPNGLDVIIESAPGAHSFAAGFFSRAGSRDETPDVAGVSHFLEHMLFKGSDRIGWQDMNRIFDEMGANYNAYTTQEMTAYYANVLPEFTDPVLQHLGQLLRPALRDEDFATEKQVILEEIAMCQDEPGHRLYEALMSSYFPGHPLGASILGSTQSITDLSVEQMRAYFAQHYGAGDLVLSMTGPYEPEQLLEKAVRLTADWPATCTRRQATVPAVGTCDQNIVDPKLNRRYTMAMMPGPSAQSPERFAARVLADVLGDEEGSRLFWALVDPAIAEDADFGFYPHDGCGSFYLSLVTDEDRTEQALAIAKKELRRITDDLSDDELQRAKNKISSQLVLGGERPLGRMRGIATEWLYTGTYRSLEDDLNTLADVTPDMLRDVLNRYPLEPLATVSLGPGADQE